MAPQRRPLLPYLCKLVGARVSNETDQDLLQRFVKHHDSYAFEILMERHSALVRGVCMRALGNTHDADDAFQATFLVLVRSARSIRRLTSVGPWLHGVARRIAHKMKTNAFRRFDHEQQAAGLLPSQHIDDITLGELKRILDEEIANLPRNFREPLILCCLEGKTRDEAAQELGWSLGAVKGRLERGREALRTRLAERGLALSTAFFTLALPQNTASAAVTPGLIAATVSVAEKLATGQALSSLVSAPMNQLVQSALNSMFVVKVKVAALTVGLILAMTWAVIGLSGLGCEEGLAEVREKNSGIAVSPADRIAPRIPKTEPTAIDAPLCFMLPFDNIVVDQVIGNDFTTALGKMSRSLPTGGGPSSDIFSSASGDFWDERQECMRYVISKR